jgi:hypothetical protein
MAYRDPDYVQKKIELIEKGLPIDISEEELAHFEHILRGARSFYIDMLQSLEARKKGGEDVEAFVVEESKNVAAVEMGLRKVDDFRKNHWKQIKAE